MLAYSTATDPDRADLETVDAGLHQYNLAIGRVQEDSGRVCVFARDGSGAVRGGAVGRRWGRCCELQQLWVDETLRNAGVGTRLLAEFEAQGARLGARTFLLDSFSFQAPEFYRKRGYVVVFSVDGFPRGHVRYTLRKEIPAGGDA